jgi:hypothetical protein
MTIFLSWSGAQSEVIAKVLRDWLPKIFFGTVKLWMSQADIDRGSRWAHEIAQNLERSSFGIVCVTADNLNAPWILFEAGALSKLTGNSHVCTYLYDLSPGDLAGPLSMFQATKADKEETRQLVHTINTCLAERTIDRDAMDEAFEVWWPRLEKALKGVSTVRTCQQPIRSDRELLEEILGLARRPFQHEAEVRAIFDPTDMYRVIAERSARNVLRRSGKLDLASVLQARDHALKAVLKSCDQNTAGVPNSKTVDVHELIVAATIRATEQEFDTLPLTGRPSRDELRGLINHLQQPHTPNSIDPFINSESSIL